MANRGATRLHHGALHVVEEMRPTYTWLLVEMIRNHLRNERIKKRELLRNNTEEDDVVLPSSAVLQQNSRTSTLSTLSQDSGYESIVRMANESPNYLVENHISLRGDAGYSSFTFEDNSPAGDEAALLVADNGQEAGAETTVTGATASPSVIIFGLPATPKHGATAQDSKQTSPLSMSGSLRHCSV